LTTAVHVPAAATAAIGPGHVATGASVSCTVTVNEQLLELPDESVAVQLTVVVPTANVEPLKGAHTTVVPGQLSDVVGAGYVTAAEHWPAAFGTVTLAGQVIAGAVVSVTVIVNVHVVSGEFGEPSTAVHDTVVTPTGKVDPDAGVQVAVAPGQLSTGAGTVKLTTVEHCPGVFGTVMFAGHVIEGASVSCTVTVNVQVPSGELGDPSLAVHVTVVVPTGKVDPDAGTQVTVAPGQLSVAVAAYTTTAEHWPAVLPTVTGAGHVTEGASVSSTVTVNEQLGPLVVVQLTVVVPTANVDPDAGVQVTTPHDPVVVGATYETLAPHWPASLPTVTFAGQAIMHEGCTVTVNVHVPIFDDASVAVHVTVVVPTRKSVPGNGAQLTVAPGQLSTAAGVA